MSSPPRPDPDATAFQLNASHFGSLVRWLHKDVGISGPRLASLLDTTPGNIRVIASRTAETDYNPSLPLVLLATPHTPAESARAGVRFGSSAFQRRARLEEQTEKVREILANRRARYEFAPAIQELRELLRSMGQPGNPRWIALKAEIHHQISWFSGHLGMSSTAIAEALKAMDLFRIAFHESRYPGYARDFIRAALPGSNSSLLRRMPQTAMSILASAKAAAESAGLVLGSEYHRQLGVAHYQLFSDDLAKKHFAQAGQAMYDLEEPPTVTSPKMAGSRHLYLLGTPNFESSAELRAEADSRLEPKV